MVDVHHSCLHAVVEYKSSSQSDKASIMLIDNQLPIIHLSAHQKLPTSNSIPLNSWTVQSSIWIQSIDRKRSIVEIFRSIFQIAYVKLSCRLFDKRAISHPLNAFLPWLMFKVHCRMYPSPMVPMNQMEFQINYEISYARDQFMARHFPFDSYVRYWAKLISAMTTSRMEREIKKTQTHTKINWIGVNVYYRKHQSHS